jgi:hypothetical protein
VLSGRVLTRRDADIEAAACDASSLTATSPPSAVVPISVLVSASARLLMLSTLDTAASAAARMAAASSERGTAALAARDALALVGAPPVTASPASLAGASPRRAPERTDPASAESSGPRTSSGLGSYIMGAF